MYGRSYPVGMISIRHKNAAPQSRIAMSQTMYDTWLPDVSYYRNALFLFSEKVFISRLYNVRVM